MPHIHKLHLWFLHTHSKTYWYLYLFVMYIKISNQLSKLWFAFQSFVFLWNSQWVCGLQSVDDKRNSNIVCSMCYVRFVPPTIRHHLFDIVTVFCFFFLQFFLFGVFSVIRILVVLFVISWIWNASKHCVCALREAPEHKKQQRAERKERNKREKKRKNNTKKSKQKAANCAITINLLLFSGEFQ